MGLLNGGIFDVADIHRVLVVVAAAVAVRRAAKKRERTAAAAHTHKKELAVAQSRSNSPRRQCPFLPGSAVWSQRRPCTAM
jgi:hypothetical protein